MATCPYRFCQLKQLVGTLLTLLVEAYTWFAEGFDTADLQETQVLLEALA
jgi:hypothetical protein